MLTNFDFIITKSTSDCGTFSIPNIVDITDDYIIPTSQSSDIDSITLIEYNIHNANDPIGTYETVIATGSSVYDDDISGITLTGYSDGVYFVEIQVTYVKDGVTYTVNTTKCVFINCTIDCCISEGIIDNQFRWGDAILLVEGMKMAESCGKCFQLSFFYNLYLNLLDNDCGC